MNFYLHRQHETKHVSVSNNANAEQLGSAQKAAFALATKLKDKLEQQSISQENFWSYVKTRFGVESRNQMSEVDWTTLAAELTAASSKKELFQEFIKKIRQIETASQESEVTKPDETEPVIVEAMPTETVQLFDYSYSHRLEKNNYFILGLTGMYLLVSLFAIYHHEMWRDEMQAWLLARDSSNLVDLLRHMKYEGHPALWHLILMPVTRLSESPIGMQVTHLVIATTTVFLIVKYSPFTPFQKFFFVFGYYPLYEYNVVCRNYAIGLLLVVVLCILLEQRYKSPVRVAITLFLLSHTSVYALILVIGTTIGLGVDYLLNSQKILEMENLKLNHS